MPLRRLGFLPGYFLFRPCASLRSDPLPLRVAGGQVSLAEREHHVWTSAVHDSEFATVAHPAARAECGAVQPPQALATPDPLLDEDRLERESQCQLHHWD